MKNIVTLVFTIALLHLGSTQTDAQINVDSTMIQMEQHIIGTWVLQDGVSHTDAQYKLIFSSNGQVKEYQGEQLLTIYDYSIETNSCNNYHAAGVYYLKWIDSDNGLSCLEISNLTNDVLSLMVIDQGKMLLFNKQP